MILTTIYHNTIINFFWGLYIKALDVDSFSAICNMPLLFIKQSGDMPLARNLVLISSRNQLKR